MKIGFIQPLGLGDIIIALPIAKHFAAQGHQVIWPISNRYLSNFATATPYVEFVPMEEDDGVAWFFERPLEILRSRGCEGVLPLMSALKVPNYPANPLLQAVLKFDEYKYAVAQVPFKEKWSLDIRRDHLREDDLFQSVVTAKRYAVCHLQGSSARAEIDMKALAGSYDQVIEITDRTDCMFDWLKVIEQASLLIMIDSCFANLVDQLGIGAEKFFVRRSEMSRTPVLGSGWKFLG